MSTHQFYLALPLSYSGKIILKYHHCVSQHTKPFYKNQGIFYLFTYFFTFYGIDLSIFMKIKGFKMSNTSKPKAKPRYEQRFEREAKALQKNLKKRKLQQEKREELKKDSHNGQN